MATIIRAPEPPEFSEKIKIFLAGSIDMGKAIEWQKEIEDALFHFDVVVYNPRRLDFDPTAEYSEDNPYMVEQIEWELKRLDECDIALFYFDPEGLAPITLFEMGKVSDWVKNGSTSGIVFCPEGYWKKANVIVNSRFFKFKIAESFTDLLNKTERAIFEHQKRKNELS